MIIAPVYLPSAWGRLQPTLTILLFCVLLLFSLTLANSSFANPLTGHSQGNEQRTTFSQQQSPTLVSGLITRLTLWQMQLKQKISSHVRGFKNDGRIAPLLPLFLIAFAYGLIHSAGPGHGKGVAMTYALAQGGGYVTGLLLGGLIALIHAGSAALLVVVLRFILQQTISTSIDSISEITQIVSYSLITLIGLALFISSIPPWFGQKRSARDSKQKKANRIAQNPLPAAFAIGVVPCPGVIMILLFCLSLDQMMLGLLLGMTVSLGMAVTITLAVWLSLAGKKITFQVSSRWKKTSYIEQGMHTFSGLLLTCLGGLFLTATL